MLQPNPFHIWENGQLNEQKGLKVSMSAAGSIHRGSLEKHGRFLKTLKIMSGLHSEKVSTDLFILPDDQSPPFQPRLNKSILRISCPAVRRADVLGLNNDGWKRRESLSSLCTRLVYLAEQNWLPDSKKRPICFCQCRSETLFVFHTISGNLEFAFFIFVLQN